MGLLETAGFLSNGPSERTFLMAKELAFKKGSRIGRTVDDHKRLFLARTPAVNSPGHQFFTSTALALNQDSGIGRGDIFNQLVDQLHLWVFADNTAKF